MTRYLMILCLMAGLELHSYGQDHRAFAKGNSIISAGMGIGNVWKTFMKETFTYPPNTFKVSSKGTFSVVYEYGFSKRISAGVALGYSKVVGDFDGFGEKFRQTLTNFSSLGRANYHFGKSAKFDPYIGIGIGYYFIEYYNDKPGIINSDGPSSFGYSAQLGAHYYFFPKWGIFAEIGYVAGSFGQIGFTARL